jgi:hypothetical protein
VICKPNKIKGCLNFSGAQNPRFGPKVYTVRCHPAPCARCSRQLGRALAPMSATVPVLERKRQERSPSLTLRGHAGLATRDQLNYACG